MTSLSLSRRGFLIAIRSRDRRLYPQWTQRTHPVGRG